MTRLPAWEVRGRPSHRSNQLHTSLLELRAAYLKRGAVSVSCKAIQIKLFTSCCLQEAELLSKDPEPGRPKLPCEGLLLQLDEARHLLEPAGTQKGESTYSCDASLLLQMLCSIQGFCPASDNAIMTCHTSCMLCVQYLPDFVSRGIADATTIVESRSNRHLFSTYTVMSSQRFCYIDGMQLGNRMLS